MATATTASKEVVLVTGANTGLGFEIAKKLLRLERFHVLIGARSDAKGSAAVQAFHEQGLTNCESLPIDITSNSSITTAAQLVEQKFGKLDVLVANAGIAPETSTPVGQVPISELIKLACDTNVAGTSQSIDTFIPLLQKAENPRVVILSTGLGSLERQTKHHNKGWPAYGASKAALNMMMLYFHHQYPEMKINACCPGFRATALNSFATAALNLVPAKTEDGASAAVRLSLLAKDGESGTYTNIDDATGEVRTVPW